ncbi:MAG: DNA polymerase III subunit gamma/tau [Candidatus Zixiibacteriota bacterium]
MAYEVLARKYRPQTFSEVIAQESVTTTLANALKAGRISSGYLFCGPRGTGKTSVARILARSINCDSGPTVTPCGKCDSCRSVGNEASFDVLEIDAASNTSVDDVRELRENVRYGPSSGGKKRIYIIDEVHRLSGSAFDALLKTLEEPPPHVMFILATTEPRKVPDTIHSRTQRFDFRRVATAELLEPLRRIAEAEGFTVTDEALRIIARRGEGSVRDAISLLDQLMSFSSGEVTADLVVSALGMVEAGFYFRFVETLAAGDASGALTMVADLTRQGADLKDFTVELADHFRTLAIIKSTDPDPARRILDITAEEQERFNGQVDFFTIGDLVRLAGILSQALLDMKDIDPRWTLEMAALKMAHLESTIRIEEALAQFGDETAGESEAAPANDCGTEEDLFGGSRRHNGDGLGVNPVPATGPQGAVQRSASESGAGVKAPHINQPKVAGAWQEFLEKVRSSSMMLASQLSMATVTEVKSNRIHASFPASGSANKDLLERPIYRSQVETALREFFGAPLTIEFGIDHSNSPKAQRGPGGSVQDDRERLHAPETSGTRVVDGIGAKEALEKDPTLRSIVERVNGKIVEIRKSEKH